MMRQYRSFAEAFRKVVRDALRKPPCIHEYERAVGKNKFGETIVDFTPHRVAGHHPELVLRNLHCEIQFPAVTAIDDANLSVRCNKLGDLFDGPHRSRKSDSLQPCPAGFHDEIVEPGER